MIPELLDGKPFRGVNLWPDLPGWRDRALAYYEACTQLTVEIHRGFALDLELEEEFFTPRLERPMTTLRCCTIRRVMVRTWGLERIPTMGT